MYIVKWSSTILLQSLCLQTIVYIVKKYVDLLHRTYILHMKHYNANLHLQFLYLIFTSSLQNGTQHFHRCVPCIPYFSFSFFNTWFYLFLVVSDGIVFIVIIHSNTLLLHFPARIKQSWHLMSIKTGLGIIWQVALTRRLFWKKIVVDLSLHFQIILLNVVMGLFST